MAGTRPGRWFRLNLWLHRWCSLVVALPFLILCLSGTLLIFHDELERLLGDVPVASAGARQQSMQQALQAVLAANPASRPLSVGLDPEQHPGVLLVVTAARSDTGFAHARLHYADLGAGRGTTISSADPDHSLVGWVLKLHAQWFLGPAGELLGSALAMMVLLALLSGLVVYAPYAKRLLFGLLRQGRDRRLLQLDLHNLLGAVVLGWCLVVTISGVLLGFGTVAQGVWQMQELPLLRAEFNGPAVDRLHPPASLDQVAHAVQSKLPAEWHPISIIFPGTDFSTPADYVVLLAGAGIHKKLLRVAIVDASSAELRRMVSLPWYLQAILMAQPLHFGDYGGWPLKILWTLCAWLTLFVTGNGAWLWWDRRRKRRHRAIAGPPE